MGSVTVSNARKGGRITEPVYHACFQDHDPKSLERLGETEQLELF